MRECDVQRRPASFVTQGSYQKVVRSAMKIRSLLIMALSCGALISVVLLSGCGATLSPAKLSQVIPVATVPYLPPTVVPNTAVPTHAPTATATPHPTRPTGSPGTPNTPGPTPTSAPLPAGPMPVGTVPNIGGQLILVSLSQQWLLAYQDQHLVLASPVTTGMPQLPTPPAAMPSSAKRPNVTFYSPLADRDRPIYYSPEHINYAMYFRDIGYYIHDAPWRHAVWPRHPVSTHQPRRNHETGSHGCVNMPTGAMSWIYRWARNGATIVIYGRAYVPPPATATPVKPTATTPPAPTATPTPVPEPTATPTP